MNAHLTSLRVLLVEDSADDADLTLLALGEAGFRIDWKRADTEIEMRAMLADASWDVVLSDFNLPRFSAHKALAVLREIDSDTPFIIVSGCIGEESAVALMKEGASDFVMKDKLARLAPAIERELRDAAVRREHRRSQEALRENEKLLKGITSSMGEGVMVLDENGKLIFMNPEAEHLLGWQQGELLGKDVRGLIFSQQQEGLPFAASASPVLEVLQDGKVHRTEENVFWRKDATPISVSITASAIIEDRHAVASVAVFQDISQRKQAEWELRESRKQLRELTAYLQTVREEERTRIARELHDELGQMLTGVKLEAKWLSNQLATQQPEIVNKVASMSGLIDETLDAMRRVAADLRPVMLDDLGLAAAVEWLTEDFGKRSGIEVRLEQDLEHGLYDCCGVQCELDAGVATAAYRIVQECLTNVSRHAQARHVRVMLQCMDDKLTLRISDDGKGVSVGGAIKRNSYGIVGMRERVNVFGGTFDFASAQGAGTTVEVVLPLKLAETGREAE